MVPSKLLRSVFLSFPLCILAFFIVSGSAYSFGTLDEEFDGDSLDPEVWDVYQNSGSITVENSVLVLRQLDPNEFPYLYTKNFTLHDNESVEIKYKITEPNFGSGFVFYDSILPNDSIPSINNVLVDVYPVGGGNIAVVAGILCGTSELSCERQYSLPYQYSADNEWHVFKLSRISNTYQFDIDSHEIFTSRPTNAQIGSLWIGNPEKTKTDVTFSKVDVDYVRVSSGTTPTQTPTPSPTPTPTPTPIPTPTPLTPVIVIPGLGGSWDMNAILNGTAGSNWQIPDFVTVYKNLIASLVNDGYELNKNLFVFAYDWRKNLADLATDLDNYVSLLIATGKITLLDKLDLVGHSYGGLVARSYGQNVGLPRIDKIITLGSPHQGVLDAYAAWEGATVWSNSWWQKAALELTMQLNQGVGESRVHTLRRLSPGIKDLLPTYDYLRSDGTLKSVSGLTAQNTALPALNSSLASINELLWANAGISHETKQFLRVQDRTWADEVSEKWADGKPIDDNPIEMAEGDGTVLLDSAVGSFTHSTQTSADHGEIVTNRPGLEKVFEELGLDQTKILETTSPDTRDRVLAIILRSPGQLRVCNSASICNESLGLYLPEQKLFMWPNYDNEALSVEVNASGETGPYHLLTGKLDVWSSRWWTTEASLDNADETDRYDNAALFDITSPVITAVFSPEANAAGWSKKNTTLSWNVLDPESLISSKIGCESLTITTETSGITQVCSAQSTGGSASASASVKLDKTPPEIRITSPKDDSAHALNSVVKAKWNATDGLSGIKEQSGTVVSGQVIDTSSKGRKTFTVSASDNAGNTKTKTVHYTVNARHSCELLKPSKHDSWRQPLAWLWEEDKTTKFRDCLDD